VNIAIPAFNWLLVEPLGLLAMAALLVLLASLFMDREEESDLAGVALVGIAAAGYTLARLWGRTSADAFGGMITIDHFSLAIGFVILFAAAAAVVLAWNDRHLGAEYLVEILLATLGMLLFAEASNLLTLFLGIEILSLPLYVLSGLHPERAGSREAAVKYVLMGAFSSGILLYGMALTYGATGALELATIAQHMASGAGSLVYVGVALVVVGLGFKLALVPFHSWAPDVYQGAPTPVTAFMSVATKAAAFAALARTLLVGYAYVYHHWLPVLWGIAALTMLAGNLMALRQTSLKRLLAYSGIGHAGYLIVALAAATGLGLFASVYYLIAYAFMNIGALAIVVGTSRDAEEGDDLANYRGLFFRHPLAAGAMVVFLLSLASIPTTAGFLAKLTILLAAVQAGDWPLAVVLVIATMIGLYVYLKVVVAMFDRGVAAASAPTGGTAAEDGDGDGGAGAAPAAAAAAPAAAAPAAAAFGRMGAGAWVVVAIAVWGTFQFGLVPGPLVHALSQSILLP
jgi:NADH-quinone oxidoreductase subunit N